MMDNRIGCFAKPPSSCPSPRKLGLPSLHLSVAASASGCGWEKGRQNYPQRKLEGLLSHPHSLANADTPRGKLAKASVRGERQSEVVFYHYARRIGSGLARALAAFALILICIVPCSAELSTGQLREVGLDPRPGAALPLGAAFSAGSARLSLKDALDGRPAVLILADFKCRYTCGTALAIAADGLTHTGLEAGRDYNLLVIGINPGAGIADAEAMKAAYLAPYPRLRAAAKFLSGDAAAIASVTDALGYKAVYDAQRDEFAHPLGAVILTPEGRVSNVIEGLNLSAALLRPAILDARESRLAAFVEGVRLLCYGRNPLEGAYTSTVQAALQGGGFADAPRHRRPRSCSSAGGKGHEHELAAASSRTGIDAGAHYRWRLPAPDRRLGGNRRARRGAHPHPFAALPARARARGAGRCANSSRASSRLPGPPPPSSCSSSCSGSPPARSSQRSCRPATRWKCT